MTRTIPSEAGGTTMRSLRERQREERAALILGVAQEVFADKGYYDASIDEIAARAGIAKGTVYLHFASKEDLLIALVEQQITAFTTWADRMLGEALPVRERLAQLFHYVYTRIQEQRNQVLLELHASMGLTTQILAKRGELQGRLTRTLEGITALLEEGKRTGELDAAVPTPIMLATLTALLAPSAYEHLLRSEQSSPAELVIYVTRLFFPPAAPAPSRVA